MNNIQTDLCTFFENNGIDISYGNRQKTPIDGTYFTFEFADGENFENNESGEFNYTVDIKCVGKSVDDIENEKTKILTVFPGKICNEDYCACVYLQSFGKTQTDDDYNYTVNIKVKIKGWRSA